MLVFKVEIDIIYNIYKKFIYNSDLNLYNLDLNFYFIWKIVYLIYWLLISYKLFLIKLIKFKNIS